MFQQLLGELNEVTFYRTNHSGSRAEKNLKLKPVSSQKQATRIEPVPDTPEVMAVAPTSPPPDHTHTKLPSLPFPPPVAETTKPSDSRTVSRQNSSASGDERVASRDDCNQRAPTTNRKWKWHHDL